MSFANRLFGMTVTFLTGAVIANTEIRLESESGYRESFSLWKETFLFKYNYTDGNWKMTSENKYFR